MVLEILRFIPAGLVIYMLIDAMVSEKIGLNQHLFKRQDNPIGYWLTFAFGCFLLYCFGFSRFFRRYSGTICTG